MKSEIDGNLASKDICIVAQTTINRDFFGEIVQNVKKTCKSTLVFDTICSATKDRQKEADELSRNSDMMIVIGGKESSNTRKLFEISKRNCKHTYHIETFEDLPQEKTYNKITVQDIVDRCHVNRNTFYYHFQDIPSLLEEIIVEMTAKVIENLPEESTFEEKVTAAL